MTGPPDPVLVRLANLGLPRRPAGARELLVEEALPDADTAARQLSGLVDAAVGDADLPGLRELHGFARRFARCVVADEPAPDPAGINAWARESRGFPQLCHDVPGGWRSPMTWLPATPVADLARLLVAEIGELDPARLKLCARAECDLVFYDRTRSRTQRWHAENPCGWRARQARHRKV